MSTILITGANKGIGLGFVKKYLSRPNTTVIATVRNPSSAEAKALDELQKGEGSKVVVVEIDSTSETDAAEAIAGLSEHGINKIDIVIANAGIYKIDAFVPISEMKTSDLMEHFNVNTAGVIRLFQAVLPLLKKGTNPRFMVISSGVATITNMEYIPFTLPSYGASKAAINFLTRRIHFENEDLIAFAVHPGVVQTEEGNVAARFFGLPGAPTTVEDSINGLVEKLDNATREKTSGKFLGFDDSPLLW